MYSNDASSDNLELKIELCVVDEKLQLALPTGAGIGPPPELGATHLGRTGIGPLPISRAYWRWWGGGWLSQNVKLHRVLMATCTISMLYP